MVSSPPVDELDAYSDFVADRAERGARIQVRTRKDTYRYARVDPIDGYLRMYSWWEGRGLGSQYPRRSTKLRQEDGSWRSVTLYLHREIAGLPQGDPALQVHHANHDIYDCRRLNLWVCTPSFNLRHQKRAKRSMLQEMWESPADELEFWPVGDARRSLGYLYELHREKHGSYPLEYHLPDLYQKIKTRVIPNADDS